MSDIFHQLAAQALGMHSTVEPLTQPRYADGNIKEFEPSPDVSQSSAETLPAAKTSSGKASSGELDLHPPFSPANSVNSVNSANSVNSVNGRETATDLAASENQREVPDVFAEVIDLSSSVEQSTFPPTESPYEQDDSLTTLLPKAPTTGTSGLGLPSSSGDNASEMPSLFLTDKQASRVLTKRDQPNTPESSEAFRPLGKKEDRRDAPEASLTEESSQRTVRPLASDQVLNLSGSDFIKFRQPNDAQSTAPHESRSKLQDVSPESLVASQERLRPRAMETQTETPSRQGGVSDVLVQGQAAESIPPAPLVATQGHPEWPSLDLPGSADSRQERETESTEASQPRILLSIGRVELRQNASPPSSAEPAPPSFEPALTLDGYLRQQRGRRP